MANEWKNLWNIFSAPFFLFPYFVASFLWRWVETDFILSISWIFKSMNWQTVLTKLIKQNGLNSKIFFSMLCPLRICRSNCLGHRLLPGWCLCVAERKREKRRKKEKKQKKEKCVGDKNRQGHGSDHKLSPRTSRCREMTLLYGSIAGSH